MGEEVPGDGEREDDFAEPNEGEEPRSDHCPHIEEHRHDGQDSHHHVVNEDLDEHVEDERNHEVVDLSCRASQNGKLVSFVFMEV